MKDTPATYEMENVLETRLRSSWLWYSDRACYNTGCVVLTYFTRQSAALKHVWCRMFSARDDNYGIAESEVNENAFGGQRLYCLCWPGVLCCLQ